MEAIFDYFSCERRYIQCKRTQFTLYIYYVRYSYVGLDLQKVYQACLLPITVTLNFLIKVKLSRCRFKLKPCLLRKMFLIILEL